MRSDPNNITINFDALSEGRSTNAAWCIEYGSTFYERDKNCHFIPKSLSSIDVENKTITMPQWLAEKKGLEQYIA